MGADNSKAKEQNYALSNNNYSESVNKTVTAYGGLVEGVRVAHSGERNEFSPKHMVRESLPEREYKINQMLSPGATKSTGAGNRATPESPDLHRTCFEKDRDRIKYASSFRRLAGKCQVYVAPKNDMLRNRLTHSIEVAQIAVSLGIALKLNIPLLEAMALGHDCGHGPGGHAAEDAFAPFLVNGFDHAIWGSDVVLKPLNLTTETLDGIRNHSWRLQPPSTPEGSILSWSDRIAYVCHDFADATKAGIIREKDLPINVKKIAGLKQSRQIGYFIDSLIESSYEKGFICISEEPAFVLDTFRKFNYERIYLREESNIQAEKVIKLLSNLVEYYIDNPERINSPLYDVPADEDSASFQAVAFVAGMTDKYAFNMAVNKLGYHKKELPTSF